MNHAADADRDALEMILKEHGEAVRRIIKPEMPVRWQAVVSLDDVMQETYTDAFLSCHQLLARTEREVLSWLTSIARRNLYDAIHMLEAKKRGGECQRIDPHSPDDSHDHLIDVLLGNGTTPSSHAARKEAHAAVNEAITQLPFHYRQVVQIYDLGQRPAQELAKKLAISEGALYMRRARALRMLREMLGRSSKYFGESA